MKPRPRIRIAGRAGPPQLVPAFVRAELLFLALVLLLAGHLLLPCLLVGASAALSRMPPP